MKQTELFEDKENVKPIKEHVLREFLRLGDLLNKVTDSKDHIATSTKTLECFNVWHDPNTKEAQ